MIGGNGVGSDVTGIRLGIGLCHRVEAEHFPHVSKGTTSFGEERWGSSLALPGRLSLRAGLVVGHFDGEHILLGSLPAFDRFFG